MICLYLFSGCGTNGTSSNNGTDWPYSNVPNDLNNIGKQVRLSNIQLPDLGVNNGCYQVWVWLPHDPNSKGNIADHPNNFYPIPVNDTIESLGQFIVTSNGKVMDRSRSILYGTTTQTAFPPLGTTLQPNFDIRNAYGVFISIEPQSQGLANVNPTAIILAGLFSDKVCPLALYLPSSIPTQSLAPTTNPAGLFTVDSPRGGTGTGIWFMNPGSTNFAGLNVPPLPKVPYEIPGYGTVNFGFKYEAWIRDITTGVYYSLGKFSDPQNPDALNPLFYSTMTPAGSRRFPFPGLDFAQAGNNLSAGFVPNALNIANGNYRSYITLEPDPDNNPQPFIFLMESGTYIPPNIAAPGQSNIYLTSTIFPSDPTNIFFPSTQPMIKMLKSNHKTDSDQFIFINDQMGNATLE
jgi:hypothetical protein